MELLQNQIKVEAPTGWHFFGCFAVWWLLQGDPLSYTETLIPHQKLNPLGVGAEWGAYAAHSPLDWAVAAVGQGTYRLDFSKTSEVLGLVKMPISPNFPELIGQYLCSSKGSCSEASWWEELAREEKSWFQGILASGHYWPTSEMGWPQCTFWGTEDWCNQV